MKPKAITELSRGIDALAPELIEAATRVIRSGWFVLGREVGAFEQEFARYCGVSHCISLANGTDALELALRSVGVRAGSRVVTVANAGMYSSTAIRAIGAHPVYADIDESSLLMSPRSLRSMDLSDCAAIVVTHLYGQLAPVEAIRAIADSAGIPLVEDCAQAHGARLGQRRAGSFGNAACFSFYPTKNLGALGDGGAVLTNDPAIAEKVAKLRQYGWSRKYFAELPGGRNSRLDEMQAAFLRVKLEGLDAANAARRRVATRYRQSIRNPHVTLPSVIDESFVAHLFVIRCAHREQLVRHLASNDVPAEVHYPLPDYRQPAMGFAAHPPLPATEAACASVLTLPCFPELEDGEVDAIANAVNAWQPVLEAA